MSRILLSSILLVSISVGCDMAVVPGGGGGQGGTSSQITEARIITSGNLKKDISTSLRGIATFRLEDFPSDQTQSPEIPELVLPGMFLDGSPSCLNTGDDRARYGINSAGELLALGFLTGSCDSQDSYFVNVYADATRLNGEQQPVRIASLEGPRDRFDNALEIAIDRERDLLYVSSDPPPGVAGPERIYVFDNISQPSFDDVVSPVRTIILPGPILAAIRFRITTMAMGTDDTLYVQRGVDVHRITNASTRDGTFTDADIETMSFGENPDVSPVKHFTLDSQNRLWLILSTGRIMRINDDFTDTDLDVSISLPPTESSNTDYFLQIDSQGIAYVYGSEILSIYPNIESGSADVETMPTGGTFMVDVEKSTPFILVE
ncbi:MAG: hypothetical protein DHS20C16_08100 [Phycisphaerae bacterium]|nr:MAG: hypothetical protein DHS20C16_08100 [Phycisphaerae bacterium]